MMDPVNTPSALLPPNVDGIPPEMRAAPRWAPYRAVWVEKKQKYEKIPHRWNRPEHGLSNKTAAGWTSFDQAMAAYQQHPDKFAGVGYLMTGPHGLVAIDLDHCVQDGVVAPWALEVAAKLDSYTEVSPSGTGLHVITSGEVPDDWANHDQGVEVYAGNVPRFLVITGQRLPGSPPAIRPLRMPVLDQMAARWRKKLTAAEVHDLHLPELIPDVLLPAIEDLDLPTHARNFLLYGPAPTDDRSQKLFAASIALCQAGLTREEVLSLLEANEHAMEVALDHRRQDYNKALRYLWKDHCQAGTARAGEIRQLQLDEFDDMDDATPAAEPVADGVGEVTVGVLDDFEVLDEETPVKAEKTAPAPAQPAQPAQPAKRPRFALLTPGDFMARKAATWMIKGVLPRAGLGVIFGASASGKTFLTLDLAMCIARGEPWRGRQVAKGRGVYIVAEGATGFRTRLEAYCQFHGVDPASLDIRFITDAPNLLDKADIRELLISILSLGRIDFVVIDTYARAMAGANENDAKDVGQAVAHCDAIHRKTGALVILVHHSGKDAGSGARGSSVLRAAADVEIEVTRTREYRAARITKMKDGEDGQEYQFRLAEVHVGEDEDGEAITSCVVEHREGPARRRPAKPLTQRQDLVLRVLDECMTLDGSGIHYSELKHLVVAQIPLDPEKKVDNRGRDVGRDIDHLVTSGVLQQNADGVILHAEPAK